MSILKIAKMGHPILRKVANLVVDPKAAEVNSLVGNMLETLADLGGGGIGLAAPQVHVSLRIVIFEVPEERNSQEKPIPLTILINPNIEAIGNKEDPNYSDTDWESCLSVPGLRGLVKRPAQIKYQALTLDGSSIEREAKGLHARVVQHECDHLDGILYPQRMKDMSSLQFISESHHTD